MSKAFRELQRLAAHGQLDSTSAAAGLRELYASGQTHTELETLLLEHIDHDDLATIISELHAEAELELEAEREADAELEQEAERERSVRMVRFEQLETEAERVRYQVHFADRAPAEVVLIRQADETRVLAEEALQARIVKVEVEEDLQTMQGDPARRRRVRERIEITYAGATHYVDVPEKD